MYSVLIVDDEEPVLDSYAFIIESGGTGFCLAGKARSGPEAIQLMYELKPDVVFMDINMPGMDGLDVLQEVHGKFPGTVYVLSTAYERFDLARRAIPLGVYAYLVKPVTKKLFIETLAGIRESLDKTRSSRKAVDSDAPVLQFMRKALWNGMTQGEWDEYRDVLKLESNHGLVCFAGIDSDRDNRFAELNARLELKYRFLFATHLNLGMYFFTGDVSRDEIASTFTAALGELLPSSILWFTGTGSTREGPSLHLSCAEAFAELRDKRNSTDVRLRERMRIIQIRREMGLASCADMLSLVNAFWDDLLVACGFELARTKLMVLFTLLIDDATGCYQSHANDNPPFIPTEEISRISSIEEIQEWIAPAFTGIWEIASRNRTSAFPVPLVKALSFIDENFSRQIQLSDAADAASVSSAYLSRLFGENMKSTFIDYLTAMRVEHAEKLIREKRMNIKEVSFAVGYQDPNYFSKIFRKLVGISPSMYAERNRDEKN
jgi:two-component system response regulator YesN